MKKFFLIPVLVLFIAACTVDDSSLKDDNNSGGTDGNQFLSVSIITTGAGTRADENAKYGEGESPEYKDGTGAENYVKQVRFYFFTASGDAAAVKYVVGGDDGEGYYLSYYDWFPSTTSGNDEGKTDESAHPGNNIEKILNAKIVIDTSKKDKMPYYMVAVLNPSEKYNNDQNLSFSELNAIVRECKVSELNQTNGLFEMSNTVYAKDGAVMEAASVAGHIYPTDTEALANPVEIFVERVMARLDLSVTMKPLDDHPGVYDTGVLYSDIDDYAGDKPAANSTDEHIYVKFLGWNVTATPDKSRLMKNINKDWAERLFGWSDEPWNEPLRFRSYWAINPAVNYQYGNFGQGLADDNNYQASENNAAAANTTFGTASAKSTVYMQENAAKDADGWHEPYDNTKVIIAAQLVRIVTDEKGQTTEKPVTMAEWGFNYYTLNGVKSIFADNLNLYKRTGAQGSYIYTKIKPEDITFVTASVQTEAIGTAASNGGAPENTAETNKGRYYVYPKLVENNSTTWTQGEGENAPVIGYNAADNLVKAMGKVKVWNEGYTYYYFSIPHLGNTGKPGEFGVVRNHIYDAEISALTGLGTPVYDPNETIYPEKPDNDDSMIAARVHILAWRLVKKTIQLSW